jgi:hypothetical protein
MQSRSKEKHIILAPPNLKQSSMHALLQRLRPTNQHHSTPLTKLLPLRMFFQQRRGNSSFQPLPVLRTLRESVQQLTLVLVTLRVSVEICFAQDIFELAVAVEDGAVRLVRLVLHDSSVDLVDGRDAAAAADHEEGVDAALDAVDGAEPGAFVFEFADGAFEFNRVAYGELVHGLRHFAAFALCGVEVDLDEDVYETWLRGLGDGRVRADDHFAGDGVAQADHHVLAGGQAEGLRVVLELEAEDARGGLTVSSSGIRGSRWLVLRKAWVALRLRLVRGGLFRLGSRCGSRPSWLWQFRCLS